ncbi:MAG: hypothetical protein ACE14V_05590 [bacterium]
MRLKLNLASSIITLTFIFAACGSAQNAASTAPIRDTTALLLLDKYAETQDKLLSYIVKYEQTMEQDYSGQIVKQYELGECRFDGTRCNFRQTQWGNISRSKGDIIPKEKAWYSSWLYDGKLSIKAGTTVVNGVRKLQTLIVPKPAKNTGRDMVTFLSTGLFMGYLEEGDNEERVDVTLRKAQSLTLHEKPELINGSLCLVIEGVTSKGKYTLWLDPNHGYNIAKSVIDRGPGNAYRANQSPLRAGYRITTSIHDVRFEQINGIWVPMELTMNYNQTHEVPKGYWKYQIHFKRMTITFNPDFTSAFIPDDIPNGCTLLVQNNTAHVLMGGNYTWKNGKPCDKKGNLLDFSE